MRGARAAADERQRMTMMLAVSTAKDAAGIDKPSLSAAATSASLNDGDKSSCSTTAAAALLDDVTVTDTTMPL